MKIIVVEDTRERKFEYYMNVPGNNDEDRARFICEKKGWLLIIGHKNSYFGLDQKESGPLDEQVIEGIKKWEISEVGGLYDICSETVHDVTNEDNVEYWRKTLFQ